MSTTPEMIRFSLSACLTTLEPMHIGSGDEENCEKDGTESFVASMISAAGGNPCIPGSSLKGVLRGRAIACGMGPAERDAIFGHEVSQGKSTTGKAGCAEFAWAYVQPQTRKCRIETRASVDPVTRTVADHLLFSEKVLEPGAKFNILVTLHTTTPALAEQLAAVLHGCTRTHPLHLGAHQRMGWGAAVLDDIKIEVCTAQDLAAWWATDLGTEGQAPALPTCPYTKPIAPQLPKQSCICFDLQLQIDGPFAVRDSERRKQNPGEADSV